MTNAPGKAQSLNADEKHLSMKGKGIGCAEEFQDMVNIWSSPPNRATNSLDKCKEEAPKWQLPNSCLRRSGSIPWMEMEENDPNSFSSGLTVFSKRGTNLQSHGIVVRFIRASLKSLRWKTIRCFLRTVLISIYLWFQSPRAAPK